MSYNSNLQTNNTNLQSILDTINALPEAGTDLPELTNPANASEVFLGKEVINQDGDTVTGTFTIDNEVNTQEDLLAELQTALAGKTGGSGSGNIDTCSVTINNLSYTPSITYITSEYGTLNTVHTNVSGNSITLTNVVCNSFLCLPCEYGSESITTTNANLLRNYNNHVYVFKITANAGGTSIINIKTGSGGGAIE